MTTRDVSVFGDAPRGPFPNGVTSAFRVTIGGRVRDADLMITGRNVQWVEWVATCSADGLELGMVYPALFTTDTGVAFTSKAGVVAMSADIGGWYAELRGQGPLMPV